MSLSRILNDEPAGSPRLIRPLQIGPSSSSLPVDHSMVSPTSPSNYLSPRTQRSSHFGRDDFPQPSRGHYSPKSYHPSPGWDQYSSDYPHGNPTSSRYVHGSRYPERESRERGGDVPPPLYQPDSDDDVQPKKRRRGDINDGDYKPSSQKRTTRRSSTRGKQPRPPSPISDLRDNTHIMTEEERRLASSDLEDCEEVWIRNLSDYILATQRRQSDVEAQFEATQAARNAQTTLQLSEYYKARLERLPLPPPTPPPAPSRSRDVSLRGTSPIDGYPDDLPFADNGISYSRQDGIARFIDDSVSGPVIPAKKRKGKDKRFDLPNEADLHNGLLDGPVPAKKRKLNRSVPVPIEDNESLLESASAARGLARLGEKDKANAQSSRELSQDTVVATPKGRKGKPRRKLAPDTLDHLGIADSVSASGEVTPVLSRPSSPSSGQPYAIIYDLDEDIPVLKKAKKVDENQMMKRVKTLEEAQRKVWTNIARRDVAKVYKYHATGYTARKNQAERLARLASVQARKPVQKAPKSTKDMQAKARRLMREMQVFWKKNEREERDVRKREQKEAIDRAKVEEEKREAARQARKLEFLISQTELYSHFVGNKLKTAEAEGEGEAPAAPKGANLELDPTTLGEIDFDDEDQTNLYRHAKHNAEEAIALAKERAAQFDVQAALDRKTNEALKLAKGQANVREETEESPGSPKGPLMDLDSNELNFQNPSSLSGPLTIGQPGMLMAQLKEYQLKGLNWLATLYEQGINGILADEMGLGKTVQSISLLAYLAETHDIWGPFLVVAPASTLHNWQQELTRFVPRLKALPYWGNVKDRATLRKFWSKKEISYNQDAPFHVLITSYQLVTQDQQYFQRVKWQYMILDEAQNIKNSQSVRWKTLLGFHCRNRLLLTGTPIQNSMQELWALLHFIMPSLFDSHDEFNEWFSKDIENVAENKGSKLNEHQLRRLHMILKPFMLRRVKRHVQNELSEKIEKDIYVDLSARQRALYKALLANVSVTDLLEKAANIGDADSARSLMNLVMQFRKVCNHPELFERADVVAPFSFCHFGRPGPLSREGDFVLLPYSSRSPVDYAIPQLLYQEGGLLDRPYELSKSPSQSSVLSKLMNIWSTDWLHKSVYDDDHGSFSFLRFADISVQEAHALHRAPLILRRLLATQDEARIRENGPYLFDSDFTASITPRASFAIPKLSFLNSSDGLPSLQNVTLSAWTQSCLSRPGLKWFVPPVVAPPITMHCSDRSFVESQTRLVEAPLESLSLYGLPPQLQEVQTACDTYTERLPGLPVNGLFGSSPRDQLPPTYMQVPEAKRLIYDSAKLARLDSLLQELKAGDHRVLVYFQMTRMMDLMEEYLIYRQYKYLRLDGSSKLEDRRDMVIDWQTKPDIFVFLLSTRAGGLGINLTAADTVIFYDHDWNPSNDAQAMDRAHRLGQTRQVTVYRLITKGTIDERIVQLARVKKDVQDIVVGNKTLTDVAKPREIVQLLLNDEQLASLDQSAPGLSEKQSDKPRQGAEGSSAAGRDLWNEEGDDFFGHSAPQPSAAEIADEDASTPVPAATTRVKKRRATGAATRGRKTGGGRRSGTTTGQATPNS
ncbi:Chromatin-remodeling ATPase INO80 [Pleurotus pulmonarius]